MKKSSTSRPFVVWLLIVLQFLLGLGALGGGGVLMAGPDGSIIHMPLSLLQSSPFANFFLPGLILFTFVGLFPCAVAYSLLTLPTWHWPNVINPFKRMHWSWAASLAAGIIVTLWITVEVQFMPAAGIHYFYFAWGWLIVLLTLLPGLRRYCKLNS
jgi:hypothetical protein